MKKIVYFHGLESPQGGRKVDLLSENYLVWAPEMDYNESGLFDKTLKILKKMKPDYIIGSSLGGYFGFMLASHLACDVKVLLFNPALHNRPTVDDIELLGDFEVKGIFVLGENDTEVDPFETIKRVEKNKNIEITLLKNGTHRTPYVVFKNQVRKLL